MEGIKKMRTRKTILRFFTEKHDFGDGKDYYERYLEVLGADDVFYCVCINSGTLQDDELKEILLAIHPYTLV